MQYPSFPFTWDSKKQEKRNENKEWEEEQRRRP
jgi:hypothetical protein